jgi:hypothetical protein
MAGSTFVLENGKEIAAMIDRMGDAMHDAVRREFKKFGRDVQDEAQRNHRYQIDSGNLVKSVRYKGTPDERGVEIWADLGLAPYARRIHYGWGTWSPDKYLENAFNKYASGLGDRIQKAIARAIEKAKK